MLVVLSAAVWASADRDDLPEPTATRHQITGTVTQAGAIICVETGPSADGDDARPTSWCGTTAQLGAPDLTVGSEVTGSVIDVETDPGSGAAFSVWEWIEVLVD